MEEKILKNHFKYLVGIFLILYLISTTIILIFSLKTKLKTISHIVSRTIHKETKLLTSLNRNNLNKLKNFMDSHRDFYLVKVYDPELHKLFSFKQKFSKKVDKIESELFKKFLKSKKNKIVDYFFIKDTLFIAVIEKLSNNLILEILYKVPQQSTNEILSEIFFSIRLITFVLLASFIISLLISNIFAHSLKNYSTLLLKENIMSLKTLGTMIAKRDSETGEHNYRVTYIAVKIAQNYPEIVDIKALIKGAFLHDIGKIAIPDRILLKPGPLTKEEFEIMKTHVLQGYEIIKDNEFLRDAVDVVLYHHERFDGKGYPKGLKGDEIPINARIFAVADVFDALISERPYKEPYPFRKSIAIIKSEKGRHFCPIVVNVFEKIALNVYNDIKDATIDQLNALIDEIIHRYFREF